MKSSHKKTNIPEMPAPPREVAMFATLLTHKIRALPPSERLEGAEECARRFALLADEIRDRQLAQEQNNSTEPPPP